MIRKITITFLLLTLLISAFATRYYVKTDGNDVNTGTTWQTAFKTISKGLTKTKNGDEIWVAMGTYQEGHIITIPSGVTLYGGFTGNEENLIERNVEINETIICGNYNYSCVENSGVIDGFHITKGGNVFHGGGIYNLNIVMNCKVYDNVVFGYPEIRCSGAGIYNQSGTIKNCVVYNNWGADCGGGINNFGTIINCTIYNNIANICGGGIHNSWAYPNSPTVINCISYSNKNGDITGGGIVKYSCFGGTLYGINGNINSDPFFVNTSGDISAWDFHLKNGSPCIDSGTLKEENIPNNDIVGNPRPGADGKICMGAYESPDVYEPTEPLPPKRLYVSPYGDNSDGLSWQKAFTSIKSATTISKSSNDFYEIWVASGTYQEGEIIEVPPKVKLYGGFNGTEDNLTARNIEANKTIIDGNNNHKCVRNYGVIDGFYILNGYSDNPYLYSGGIDNYGVVVNCFVYKNKMRGIYNFNTIYNSMIYENDYSGVENEGWIINCDVYKNDGTGIYNIFGTVINSRIYENTCLSRGGGIYNYGSAINCVIYKNNSGSGGGVYNLRTLINCTVYSNTASSIGGIYNSSGTIINCISWGNLNGDIIQRQGFEGSITYSCYSESDGMNGNISDNPLFVNISGDPSIWDFHLQPDSPCIDSGCYTDLSKTDFEGHQRGFNGTFIPRGDGSDYDIGADEFTNAKQKNNAIYVTDTIPTVIPLNTNTPMSIVFKNTGNMTWVPGNLYRLGINKDYPPSGWPGRVNVPHNTPPGEEATLNFWVCPKEEGELTISFQMLQEYKEWFGEIFNKTIKVFRYTNVNNKVFELY